MLQHLKVEDLSESVAIRL